MLLLGEGVSSEHPPNWVKVKVGVENKPNNEVNIQSFPHKLSINPTMSSCVVCTVYIIHCISI